MELIDETEESYTSVNEENEDVSYEVVYQQEDQLDTSSIQNKGRKTLSQKREFRRKNRSKLTSFYKKLLFFLCICLYFRFWLLIEHDGFF